MKRLLAVAALAALIAGCARAQKGPSFDAWFVDRTMRIDYFHAGSSSEETITLDRVYDQGLWVGGRSRLIDPFNLGRYLVKVYDENIFFIKIMEAKNNVLSSMFCYDDCHGFISHDHRHLFLRCR